MTDIRVERFATGNNQEHGAEHDETPPTVDREEFVSMNRIDGGQHLWRANDMSNSEQANCRKPNHRDWAEHRTHPSGAARLKEEKPNQNDDGNRHDVVIEQRCGHV